MSEARRKVSKPQLDGEAAPLSPHRAFVIQFCGGTIAEPGQFAGRVEHVVSGRAIHFTSLQEFLEFIKQILIDVDEKPP